MAQGVVQTLTAYHVKVRNVMEFHTHKASGHNVEGLSGGASGTLSKLLHITCLAHILNLVGDAFYGSFQDVNNFVLQ